MERRNLTLVVSATLLAIVVAIVVVANGGSDDDSGSVDSGGKPEVEVPEGPPPTELVSTDITEGEGEAAKTGDRVSVQYVGVDYETGEEFDASYDRGQPFPFQLGGGQVIPGWDQGVVGMKPGGRRQLVIPPDLAYGAQGQPPSIAPNATLVFVIDLESIE